MDGLKESKQARRRRGAGRRCRTSRRRPILAQASRLNFSTRLFNLLVTNVPGPQFPLYVLGRELQDLFPLAFLPRHHALAIAIMSYNGGIDFGLLGDYDAMHDLDAFGEMVDDSLNELVTAAKRRRASNGRAKPKPKPAGKKKPAAKSKSKASQLSSRARTSRPRTSCPGSTAGVKTIVRDDLVDAVDLAHELLHLLRHLRADRAGGRRERERDVDLAAFDPDLVDEAELDEVEPELRIDDVAERFRDVFLGEHTLEDSPGL